MSPEPDAGKSAQPAAKPFLYTAVGSEPATASPSVAPPAPASPVPGPTSADSTTRAGFEKVLAEIRSQISGALRQFATEREAYFERVEVEVVQLALSIARKILHREAQIDPLLLTGVVHVALERLNEGTKTRLRTHPDEIRFWRDYFSQTDDIRPVPELIGDASLKPGQCTLETELGTTHISLETQLKEIEHGILDLLEQRPRVQE